MDTTNVLFNQKCNTTPNKLRALLEQSFIDPRIIEIRNFANQLVFYLGDGLPIGHVEAHPVNDLESLVKIVVYESKEKMVSWPELQSRDQSAREYLQELSDWLTRLFGSSSEPSKKHTDSDHYNYPPRRRREIVEHYRKDKEQGKVKNKDGWATVNYGISGRTLLNYEKEFPPET